MLLSLSISVLSPSGDYQHAKKYEQQRPEQIPTEPVDGKDAAKQDQKANNDDYCAQKDADVITAPVCLILYSLGKVLGVLPDIFGESLPPRTIGIVRLSRLRFVRHDQGQDYVNQDARAAAKHEQQKDNAEDYGVNAEMIAKAAAHAGNDPVGPAAIKPLGLSIVVHN